MYILRLIKFSITWMIIIYEIENFIRSKMYMEDITVYHISVC